MLVLVIFLAQAIALISPQQVSGEISACSVTVNPSQVRVDESTDVTFEVTNDSGNTAAYVYVGRPAAEVTIESVSVETWSVGGGEDFLEFTGGTLGAGETLTFSLTLSMVGQAEASGNWEIRLSEGSSGLEPTSCNGDTSFSASADQFPPVISDVLLTNMSTDKVTVKWTTDKPSTSQVFYGNSDAYGSSSNKSSSLVTNHSINITGLTPDTAYHYKVQSSDDGNRTADSEDNTFLTPSGDVSQPLSSGIKITGLKTVPTEKVPPTIVLYTDVSKPLKAVPTLTGTAEDNEAVAGVLYSLDDGKNWLPVETATGLGSKKVTFSFTPLNLQDGDYKLKVGVIDTSSNETTTPTQLLVIDRLPPTVGANIIATGAQTLAPDKDNVISSMVGIEQTITLSAVGGPRSIVIAATNINSGEVIQTYNLTKSEDNGLWSGVLSYSEPGIYRLVARSVDGAENKTSRDLNVVSVSEPGKVTDKAGKSMEASVTVYVLDVETNRWELWDGASYDQPNPLMTSAQGTYGLYLPGGTYYLKVEKPTYQTIVTRSFKLASAQAINGIFEMNQKPGFKLGPINIRLPIPAIKGNALVTSERNYTAPKLAALGKTMPDFTLPGTNGAQVRMTELYGKPTVITFMNTWSDAASQHLKMLDSIKDPYLNIVAVGSGESVSKLSAYGRIAGLKMPVLSDKDNDLIKKLEGTTIPVTYFIDRRGEVKKFIVGVLSARELYENVAL